MPLLPETLRVFPLPNVVLFPDTILPLHVFEPRYRKMLAHALAGDRMLGIVLLRGSEASNGEPAVYPIGCAGRIVAHEPLPDGRSLIVLRGETRFRILEELDTDKPYRVMRVQALHEAPVRIDAEQGWREDLRSRLSEGDLTHGEDGEQLARMFEKADSASLVNQLCMSLPIDVLERQGLLECATVDERCQLLLRVLDFREAEQRLGLESGRLADT